jgi:Tfp pilus assembly protein PilZ
VLALGNISKSAIKKRFMPLGLGLLSVVVLKMVGLYAIYWLFIKEHKVFVTTRTLQDHVFSIEKKGDVP